MCTTCVVGFIVSPVIRSYRDRHRRFVNILQGIKSLSECDGQLQPPSPFRFDIYTWQVAKVVQVLQTIQHCFATVKWSREAAGEYPPLPPRGECGRHPSIHFYQRCGQEEIQRCSAWASSTCFQGFGKCHCPKWELQSPFTGWRGIKGTDITSLTVAEDCQYRPPKEEMIQDRVVVSIIMRFLLIRKSSDGPRPDSGRGQNHGRQWEAVHEQQTILHRGKTEETASLDFVGRKLAPTKTIASKQAVRWAPQLSIRKCTCCGRVPHTH